MKPISTLVLLLFTCIGMQAQWKIGPKFSYGTITQNAAQINVVPMDNFSSYDFQFTGSSNVKSIGFMAIHDLGPVFLQTEFMATSYGLDFVLSGYKNMDEGQYLYHEQFYVLEIPFNAGVNIGNFKLGLGPVLDITLDTDSELSTVPGYKNTSKDLDFGFQGLLGYQLGIFHLDLKYINKFSSITDGFSFGYDILKYRKSANRLVLGIGVTF